MPAQDVAHLVGAHREATGGRWFPPDFAYAQHTGARLRVPIPTVDFAWVPPFGAAALPGATSLTRGSRQTPRPLALAHLHDRSLDDEPDRTLPALPPGQYRFVVDRFGLASPILVAVEPERGDLLVLLPESRSWIALERTVGAAWAQALRNPRGWRMELVHAAGQATAYCPSDTGLVALTPRAFGLCYAARHEGEGPAVGGPVAWGGVVWLPVAGSDGVVQLVGKRHGVPGHVVLPTDAPVPRHGFEAPAFDGRHVNWPCREGQLVLRLDAHGNKRCDWIAWPRGVVPLFEFGWPYRQATGTFWQVCRSVGSDGRFAHVQMAAAMPTCMPAEGLHLCTGRACYSGTWRIEGDPWRAPRPMDDGSGEIVVPLLESTYEGVVVGLRMDAPHGVLALLEAGNERQRAVLQVEARGRRAVPFGTLQVSKPWLAQLFVHEGHLWVAHPDLPQAAGWKLGQ